MLDSGFCCLSSLTLFFLCSMVIGTNLTLNKELVSVFFIKSFAVKKNIDLTFLVTAVRQEGIL